MQFDEMTEDYIAKTDWIGNIDIDDVVVQMENQLERDIQAQIPSEETWVDRNHNMIAIGDWVDVHWKVKNVNNDPVQNYVTGEWIEHSLEAKIIDIFPADSDWDDENNRAIYFDSQVVVEYKENGVIVEECLSCEYLPYENKNVCHDISLKEF